jgi:hypothetical protein
MWLPGFNERGFGQWHATSGCPTRRCEASLAASSAASLADGTHPGYPGGTPYPPPVREGGRPYRVLGKRGSDNPETSC